MFRFSFGISLLSLLLLLAHFAYSSDMSPKAVNRPIDSEIAGHITQKIINKLNLTSGVSVKIKSGIVTLTGSVDSLRVKDEVVELAESVRGVTTVVDELKLKIFKRTTDQITKDIKRLLALNGATRSFNIVVTVNLDGVRLRGKVDSMAEKYLASYIVKGVKGVVGISNEIQVSPMRHRSDSEIRQDVKNVLISDPIINERQIKVSVKNSTVSFAGSVPSLYQKRRLFKDALVDGVMDTDLSKVIVDSTLHNPEFSRKIPKNDDQIQVYLNKAFKMDPRLKNSAPHADVNQHVATLSGPVVNLSAQNAAEDDARNTVGIHKVENELFVRSQRSRPDFEIRTDVADVIGMDPLLDAFPIDVQVKKGIVTLSGNVDTDYERGDANEQVATIDGVQAIRDYIKLYQPIPATTSVLDSKILTSITNFLRDDPNLNFGDQVAATVEKGSATLSGSVLSWQNSFEAVEDAYDGGAIKVINKITINGQKTSDVKEYPTIPYYSTFYGWNHGYN